jgi:diaminohydroxyphosphoribosylaminopyrimidine deaminase/5-amino-6-(5-phosphoribosylamino)uracil reductase
MSTHTSEHEIFMQRCIQLAKKGKGFASPNPMVGSVIVHQGKIIGEGYHRKCGQAHAEVNAIASVKDKALLMESTIYVSLEPCAHYGKTPPCADLIVSHNIPNVVIGMKDPFAKVDGLGIEKLEKSGANVVVGVLEEECKALNAEFITYHEKKRPYVILKWAETRDGFIDICRSEEMEAQPTWITHEVCRALVHKWRTEIPSIMIGTNTAGADNPKLNVRSWTGKDPVRIVLDGDLRLSKSLNVFDNSQITLVLNYRKAAMEGNTEYILLDRAKELPIQILEVLYSRKLLSVLIEGGQQFLQTFIDAGLWDEARIFTGNKTFGEGIKAPTISGTVKFQEDIRGDRLLVVVKS